MATGNNAIGTLVPVPGIRMSAVSAGVRYQNRLDLVLFELAEGTRTAGVFTRNAFCAAPVVLARKHLQASAGAVRYLLVNTGNANAGTGDQGMIDARHCCQALADAADVELTRVLPFSTGVIGERLSLIHI